MFMFMPEAVDRFGYSLPFGKWNILQNEKQLPPLPTDTARTEKNLLDLWRSKCLIVTRRKKFRLLKYIKSISNSLGDSYKKYSIHKMEFKIIELIKN
ncbi:hypothetical protein CEXT_501591 [Caerostris extrusa]|uniref:Uncharacterized protein n=1 Tax=Caerostris extrusa TaxID=172846 RepID=A0AAV4T768_CAEEX|nr:hypothetical protein CEXT_501591 [Caerostris extrusa]